MDKVDVLYHALLAREVEWTNRTTEIFSKAEYLTQGIINYLDLPIASIKWESIDVFGQEMMIQVSIPNTDRFEYVEPGERNIQTLTIVLPVSVVEAEDTDLITAFLHDTEDVRKDDHLQPDTEESAQGIVAYSLASKETIH
jgi:hypothetical protein